MEPDESDFKGWGTKYNVKCTDGRTIMPNAFAHQDAARVPLVWQHGHKNPENVLGHAILENRADGVYVEAFFNDSPNAKLVRGQVQHKDITMMSIYANDLVQRASRVMHGAIKEISLVIAGANPGAVIENVTLRHADGDLEDLDNEVIIFTGLEIEHSDKTDDDDDLDEELDDLLEHDDTTPTDATIQDIVDGMDPQEINVLHYLVGQALEAGAAQHSDIDDDPKNPKGDEMKHNVFEDEKGKGAKPSRVLSHDDMKGIIEYATKNGSLKEAVLAYADEHLEHGIDDIDILFPDAQNLNGSPDFISRQMDWVDKVLSPARKSPFSRIKTVTADITVEEARAKGYVKGTMKKEEFFGLMKRTTTPTTVYKKQKLDRDDMVDITDFDVVTWLKGEMRVMLNEEIARACLLGDGRDISSDDKINEQNIRPIATDNELYTTTININLDDAASSIQEFVDAVVANRQFWKGTGLPTMYTTESYIAQFLLLKDSLGRRIYPSLADLATELRVSEIVPVEPMEDYSDLVAIFVNMADYVMGATAGGQVSMFDDFDIDYNQYKYLIETRMCGAMTKVKGALVVRKVAGNAVLVTPNAPTYDPATGHVTVVATSHVVYKDGDGSTITAGGSPYTVDDGDTYTVVATPTTGYYFATNADAIWKFTKRPS